MEFSSMNNVFAIENLFGSCSVYCEQRGKLNDRSLSVHKMTSVARNIFLKRSLSVSPWRTANTYSEHCATFQRGGQIMSKNARDHAWQQVRNEVKGNKGVKPASFRLDKSWAMHESEVARAEAKQQSRWRHYE